MKLSWSVNSRGGLALCATLVVGLAACGGDAGTGSTAAAGAEAAADEGPAPATAKAGGPGVEVVAKDIAFEPGEITVGSGPTQITLRNDGAIVHTLLIEGAPGFKKLEVAKGTTDTGTLDLAPGTYTAYCDEPGHRAAGMEAKLTVG